MENPYGAPPLWLKESPNNHRLMIGGSDYGRYEWIRSHIPPGARVLDVGCNCGQMGVGLAQDLGCRVTGVDVVQEFINNCREDKAEYFEQLICADFSAMNPGQVRALDPFDVVVAGEVIEHPMGGGLRAFIRNMFLALKPGGKAIVTTPAPTAFWYGFLRGGSGHVRVWTKQRLRQVFGPDILIKDLTRIDSRPGADKLIGIVVFA